MPLMRQRIDGTALALARAFARAIYCQVVRCAQLVEGLIRVRVRVGLRVGVGVGVGVGVEVEVGVGVGVGVEVEVGVSPRPRLAQSSPRRAR